MTTLNEVRSARETNSKAIFNMEVAMKALAETPAKVHKSGALGELSTNIIACLEQAGAPVAVNQLVAMLNAGGMSVTSKKVSDVAWGLAKNNRIAKAEGRGMYTAK